MDRQGTGLFLRLFYPEFTKNRKLLGFRQTRIDGKTASRQTVGLPQAYRPEIAGTQKDGDLIKGLIALEWVVKAQAGKTEVFRQRIRELVLPIIK